MVTVFFSDVTGFTDISARLPPIKVMRLLERLYTLFDGITAKHGLFKVRQSVLCTPALLPLARMPDLRRQVETIGDAYMVCGNLLDGQEADHTARVAAFAADVVAAASTVAVDEGDPAAGFVVIRAGFHTGPCVASVVGQTNPRYCLFGA